MVHACVYATPTLTQTLLTPLSTPQKVETSRAAQAKRMDRYKLLSGSWEGEVKALMVRCTLWLVPRP